MSAYEGGCAHCGNRGYIEVADMTPLGWILLVVGIAGIIWGLAGAGFFLGLIAFFVFMAGLITLLNNSKYASY
jgi:membrane-bound ClpP family serine protease